MPKEPVVATILGKPFACLVCGVDEFIARPVKLNTTGAEFLGWEWLNETATGLVCTQCGFVHEFAGEALQVSDAPRTSASN